MAKRITEREVEAIYNRSQHKIKNVPGYAEAFQRVYDQFRKVTQAGYVENDHDRKLLDDAIGDLMLIEMGLAVGIDLSGDVKRINES